MGGDYYAPSDSDMSGSDYDFYGDKYMRREAPEEDGEWLKEIEAHRKFVAKESRRFGGRRSSRRPELKAERLLNKERVEREEDEKRRKREDVEECRRAESDAEKKKMCKRVRAETEEQPDDIERRTRHGRKEGEQELSSENAVLLSCVREFFLHIAEEKATEQLKAFDKFVAKRRREEEEKEEEKRKKKKDEETTEEKKKKEKKEKK